MGEFLIKIFVAGIILAGVLSAVITFAYLYWKNG